MTNAIMLYFASDHEEWPCASMRRTDGRIHYRPGHYPTSTTGDIAGAVALRPRHTRRGQGYRDNVREPGLYRARGARPHRAKRRRPRRPTPPGWVFALATVYALAAGALFTPAPYAALGCGLASLAFAMAAAVLAVRAELQRPTPPVQRRVTTAHDLNALPTMPINIRASQARHGQDQRA